MDHKPMHASKPRHPHAKRRTVTFDLPNQIVNQAHCLPAPKDWPSTIERIAQMAATVIPYHVLSCPTSPSDQQSLVIDIVEKLCGAAHLKTSLDAQYERKRKRLKLLKHQCRDLLQAVKEKQSLLNTHLQMVKDEEEASVTKKVTELKTILAAHYAIPNDSLPRTSKNV
jgi:hypothetical protein